MPNQTLTMLITLILQLPPGTHFTLRELLGGQWDAVAGHRPQVFGRQFADAVANGLVPGVVFHEVRRAGRENVWRKL